MCIWANVGGLRKPPEVMTLTSSDVVVEKGKGSADGIGLALFRIDVPLLFAFHHYNVALS